MKRGEQNKRRAYMLELAKDGNFAFHMPCGLGFPAPELFLVNNLDSHLQVCLAVDSDLDHAKLSPAELLVGDFIIVYAVLDLGRYVVLLLFFVVVCKETQTGFFYFFGGVIPEL